jgi:hypothetical protein
MDPTTGKASSDAARRPRLASDDLFANLKEQVDYGSDTSMALPHCLPEPEARELRAPNPFPELGAAHELTALRVSSGLESGVITNALDGVQERQLEEGEVQRSQRPEAGPLVSSHRDYRFRARDPVEVVREVVVLRYTKMSDAVSLAANTTNRRVEVGACWPVLSCPSGPAVLGQ